MCPDGALKHNLYERQVGKIKSVKMDRMKKSKRRKKLMWKEMRLLKKAL